MFLDFNPRIFPRISGQSWRLNAQENPGPKARVGFVPSRDALLGRQHHGRSPGSATRNSSDESERGVGPISERRRPVPSGEGRAGCPRLPGLARIASSHLGVDVRTNRQRPAPMDKRVQQLCVQSAQPRERPSTDRNQINDLAEAWLGRQDSNLGMAVPKTAALPLGDAPSAPSRRFSRRAGQGWQPA